MNTESNELKAALMIRFHHYTVYPGVAQIPADAWIAEPLSG